MKMQKLDQIELPLANRDVAPSTFFSPGGTVPVEPTPGRSRRGTIQQEFEKFHQKNPKVYEAYVRIALDLKGRGKKKGSISQITEHIRWEVYLSTDNDEFKICNSFRSRYARKLMDDHPALVGFFEIRELKS
jgi:hypothetical protein